MNSKRNLIAALALMLTLTACGTRPSDRMGSGSVIGAGTGAAIGAIFGGLGALPGALIGGALGAGTGGLTTADQIDLGRPIWRRSE